MGALPAPVDALPAWTVREAVTNVMRHSRATECRIELTRTAERARLTIVDNGKQSAAPSSPPNAGVGLIGLRERSAALGALLEAGASERGFAVKVEVPLRQALRKSPT